MQYNIKYLENISGVKAHTIRIWEKRYNMLEPKRTPTNIRYYDNYHLKKILNVTTLLDAGYKISRIAKMSDDQLAVELKKCLEKSEEPSDLATFLINELIVASLQFDKSYFEKTFNSGVLKLGFANVIEKVLFPTLLKIGVMWQSEEINPAQEHFFSSMVKQKLFSAIDGLKEPDIASQKCILFLPEDEEHEIGLLYFNYLLIKSGIKTIYLGTRMPIENIAQAVDTVKPSHLVFFIIKLSPMNEIDNYLKNMGKLFPKQKIILCGNPEYYHQLKFPSNIIYINSPDAAKKYFKLKTEA